MSKKQRKAYTDAQINGFAQQIYDALDSDGFGGLSVSQLMTKCRLSSPAVAAGLEKNPGIILKDGLWMIKDPQKNKEAVMAQPVKLTVIEERVQKLLQELQKGAVKTDPLRETMGLPRQAFDNAMSALRKKIYVMRYEGEPGVWWYKLRDDNQPSESAAGEKKKDVNDDQTRDWVADHVHQAVQPRTAPADDHVHQGVQLSTATADDQVPQRENSESDEPVNENGIVVISPDLPVRPVVMNTELPANETQQPEASESPLDVGVKAIDGVKKSEQIDLPCNSEMNKITAAIQGIEVKRVVIATDEVKLNSEQVNKVLLTVFGMENIEWSHDDGRIQVRMLKSDVLEASNIQSTVAAGA